MNICSSGHAEIAHEEGFRDCPICELIAEKDDTISDLHKEIDKLNEVVDALREG